MGFMGTPKGEKRMKYQLCAAAVIALLAATPAKADGQHYMGEIIITAAIHCPRGTLMAHGQLLTIDHSNQSLFQLLGHTYGGDGNKTFALPDLRNKYTTTNNKPLKACITVEGIFPSLQ